MSKSLSLAVFALACFAAAFWPGGGPPGGKMPLGRAGTTSTGLRTEPQDRRMTHAEFLAVYRAGRAAAVRDCAREVWGTDEPPRPGVDFPLEDIAGKLQLWFDQWTAFETCLETKGYRVP